MSTLAVEPPVSASAGSVRRARRRDLRLAPVAGSAWLAAGVATRWPESAAILASVCAAMAAVAVCLAVWGARTVRPSAAPALALLAAAGALAGAAAAHVAMAQPARAEALALPVSGGRAAEAQVTAVGKVEPTATGWQFYAVLETLTIGAQSHHPGIPVLVRVTQTQEGLDLGSRVRVSATLSPADAGRREVLVVRAAGVAEVIAPPPGILGAASALRHGLAAVTGSLPQPGAGLVAGLSVGDTSRVPDELDAAMKTTSLSHLTAVSGANCALVVGLAFGAAALCGMPRAVRVGAGLAALAGFVVLVSPEPSVVRAAAMATIAMLGVLLGRPGAGFSLLTCAVIVLLIVDPWLSSSIGFALSAAATGALLLGAGPLADGLSRWMPQPLALAIAVPLAAQLACGPLLVIIAPQVPFFGVLANLLCAPAAPLGTVLGLAACLCAGIPLLGAGLAALAWLPAAWIAATAEVFAGLPGATLPWMAGLPGVATLALVGLAVAVVIVRTAGWARRASVAVLVSVVFLGLATGPVTAVVARARVPGAWSIAACDVGQGDAVIIRSAGRVALVDTGPDPAPLRACLDLLGVARIDLLVLTHFDLDHRGGAGALIGRVDAVLHGPLSSAEDARLLAHLADGGATVQEVRAGAHGVLGEARWRVLWPVPGVPAGNGASVAMDVHGGGVPAVLLLGDLTAQTQQRLRASATLLSAYSVVKVAHHGSADQDATLYQRARGAVALITVGENTYGHPRREIIDIVEGAGARVVRTDHGGTATLWEERGALRLWRERAETDAAVAPAG